MNPTGQKIWIRHLLIGTIEESDNGQWIARSARNGKILGIRETKKQAMHRLLEMARMAMIMNQHEAKRGK